MLLLSIPEAPKALARTLVGAVLTGGLAGAASALFLALLDLTTRTREGHPALVLGLPFAGVALGLFLDRLAGPAKKGMSAVLAATESDEARVPKRLFPIVLGGTLLTHLFGGSAGREGTAVQMGASVADMIARALGLRAAERRNLLLAGIAGGFGSVFGTPFAGVVFALEVPVVGKLAVDALLPALVASLTGDLVARAWGTAHTPYPHLAELPSSPTVVAKLVGLGLVCAAAAALFVEAVHAIKRAAEAKRVPLPARLAIGGAIVAAISRVPGAEAYLGLGVPTIVRAFSDPSLPAYAPLVKLALTAITIGAGFLGGEVTPLFFVGATLGAVYARLVALPIALGAACGMAAVFGAAANTPIALSIMVVELVGAAALPHVLVVSAVAFVASGRRGIYGGQRFSFDRTGRPLSPPPSLDELVRDRDRR